MLDRASLRAQADEYERTLGREAEPYTDAVRTEADQAVAGAIHFMDGQYVTIGRTQIDWTGSHIAHHVWKERPKRFLYLPPLMAAYTATGADAYAEAARDYLADFIRAHPSQPGWAMPRYDNGLNLGIRVPYWAKALAIFANSPAWDDAFCEEVLASIACQLAFIRAHLSPRGNFRMVQAMALIETGLRLPFLPDAVTWMQTGARVMNDAARRQVLPDGAHIECTAGYHGWMTTLFHDCLKLATAYPCLGLTISTDMVAAMYDYAAAVTKPNGDSCGLHDIEGAWEGRHTNKFAKRREAFHHEHNLSESQPPLAQVFPVAGQAYLRDGWGEDATYVTFDATRWGGAHNHLSRNAIQVHAFGRTLLMDPGRISYEMGDPLGPYGKSTRAHSTVTLNGWNQTPTNPDDFRTFHAPGYDCVTSRYTGGYWNAPFGWWFSEGFGHGLAATHTRHLFWAHGRWIAIIDEVTRWQEPGRGPEHEFPRLEVNWQFSPGRLDVDAAQHRAVTRHPDANLLLCVAQAPQNAMLQLDEGSTNPHRGWVRAMGRGGGVPAPQLSVTCAPWEGYMDTLVTLLVPFRGEEPPALTTQYFAADASRAAHLVVAWEDGTRETLHWTAGLDSMLGSIGGVETDGVMLYEQLTADGERAAFAAVDAIDIIGADAGIIMHLGPAPKGQALCTQNNR